VIRSFASRLAKDLFQDRRGPTLRRFPADLRALAGRKLQYLNAAGRLQDLAVPSGNRLEALKGDLRGFHSIRINDQWRVVFRWNEGGPSEVDVTDYH
jgi:proteic killer suppression protein